MWWSTWAIGGVLLAVCSLIKEEDKGETRVINELLGSKGYVKFYNPKSKIYGIELNAGSQFKNLEDLKGSIENVLKSNVEIINDNFMYYIKPVERKMIPNLVPFRLFDTKAINGLSVVVAMGADNPIYLDFTKVPHTLIAGATGWGKSIFTKNLILQILNNFPSAEFELFDFKAGIELGDFKDLKQTKSFIIRPHQAEDEINRIYGEIEDRFTAITATNSRDWIAHNKKSNVKMNVKFVIIEEFTILIDQSKEMKNVLTKALAIARAVGVFFVFTSQRFSVDVIDGKIKANIDNRICFHTADGTNSKVILDTTGAERLNTVGRCLISVAGVMQEGQTPHVKESDVQKCIESHIIKRRATIDSNLIINSEQIKKGSQEPKTGNTEGALTWV